MKRKYKVAFQAVITRVEGPDPQAQLGSPERQEYRDDQYRQALVLEVEAESATQAKTKVELALIGLVGT